MKKKQEEYPYKRLGNQLKKLRVKLQESLAEVSGAVEIDVSTLSEIESGLQRPSEDILLLLISHFSVKEDEAVELWELAEFDDTDLPIKNGTNHDEQTIKQTAVVTPDDLRISYTDMVHVSVNDYGVIINFMQGAGPTSQPMIVSRLGMSKEHAKSVLEVLQKTLEQSDKKSLPAPKQDKEN